MLFINAGRTYYGAGELYTRWATCSLALHHDFFREVGQPLFQRTGVLWLARADTALQ